MTLLACFSIPHTYYVQCYICICKLIVGNCSVIAKSREQLKSKGKNGTQLDAGKELIERPVTMVSVVEGMCVHITTYVQ